MRKKVKLLIVDEHTGFCELVKEIAELSNHVYDITCEITSSGVRAQELLRSWDPSVILIDAHLTDVNSSDLVRECKDSRAAIVVTSNEHSRSIEESARLWGASGYLTKSESVEDVERLVQELASISTVESQYH